MPSKRTKSKRRFAQQKPGIAETYISSNYTYSETTECWKNGHVLHLFITKNRDVKETCKKLCGLMDKEVTGYSIRKLVNTFKKFKKLRDSKEFARFEVLCADNFKVLPVNPSGVRRRRLDVNTSVSESPNTTCVSPLKTRRTCRNCTLLRSSLRTSIQERNELKKERFKNKIRHRKLSEKLRRRDATILKLRQSLANQEHIVVVS